MPTATIDQLKAIGNKASETLCGSGPESSRCKAEIAGATLGFALSAPLGAIPGAIIGGTREQVKNGKPLLPALRDELLRVAEKLGIMKPVNPDQFTLWLEKNPEAAARIVDLIRRMPVPQENIKLPEQVPNDHRLPEKGKK